MLKRKLNLKCLACNGDFGLSGRKYRESYPDYVTTCYATCKNCGKKYLVGDDGQDQLIIKEIIKQKKQKKETGLNAFVKKLETQHPTETDGYKTLLNIIESNKDNPISLEDKLNLRR